MRLEQGGDEEAVGGGFDGSDFTSRSAGYYREPGLHGCPFVLGIDFEVAEEFFGDYFFVFAVKRLQVRARAKADLWDFAGELGRVAFASGDGAGYGIDDDVFRSGIVFGGVGVLDAEDVAGEFDESVLEAAAGAEKRPVTAAGELDAFEHAVKTFVGTAGRGPESIETAEDFVGGRGGQGWGGYPLGLDGQIELVGGMLQGIGGGVVGREFRIEVTEDSDANGVTHVVIVLEGLGWFG